MQNIDWNVLEPLFAAMLLFQLKHFVCDYVLQTKTQIQFKGVYLHPWGFVHSGLHVIGSLPALWLLTNHTGVIAVLAAIEFVIHYHMDWSKSQVDRAMKLTPADGFYWTILGFDQLIHQLTYVGMMYFALRGF